MKLEIWMPFSLVAAAEHALKGQLSAGQFCLTSLNPTPRSFGTLSDTATLLEALELSVVDA